MRSTREAFRLVERARPFLARLLEPCRQCAPYRRRMSERLITLFHGTSTRSWQRAQERGEVSCTDPRELAAYVEAEAGLPAGAIWNHAMNMFSRDARLGDGDVYLSGDYRVASSYAATGGEALQDAIRAAFMFEHPRTNAFLSPGRERIARYCADWRAARAIEPLILELAMPVSRIPVPGHLRQDLQDDPGLWYDLASEHGPLGTLQLQGPLPLEWVIEVAAPRELDPHEYAWAS